MAHAAIVSSGQRPMAVATHGSTRLTAYCHAALDLLFPAICPVCDARLGPGRRDPLCGACWAAIPRLAPPWCDRCGLPFPTFAPSPGEASHGDAAGGLAARAAGTLAGRCQACALDAPGFAWARAGAVYEGVVREAVHALKFGGRRAVARPLGDLVVETLGDAIPGDLDALVPVPLAPARERERGFNQAALVAERIAWRLGLPVERGWLRRTRATAPQTELSGAERRANVRGAFAASASVRGRAVAVVDDVLTTGATVAECARALRAAGARRVGVLTVARVA